MTECVRMLLLAPYVGGEFFELVTRLGDGAFRVTAVRVLQQ